MRAGRYTVYLTTTLVNHKKNKHTWPAQPCIIRPTDYACGRDRTWGVGVYQSHRSRCGAVGLSMQRARARESLVRISGPEQGRAKMNGREEGGGRAPTATAPTSCGDVKGEIHRAHRGTRNECHLSRPVGPVSKWEVTNLVLQMVVASQMQIDSISNVS